MKKDCESCDSIAEKTVGELNEKQKDELVRSFIYALKRLSEGVKNFLTVGAISLVGAALAITYYFFKR